MLLLVYCTAWSCQTYAGQSAISSRLLAAAVFVQCESVRAVMPVRLSFAKGNLDNAHAHVKVHGLSLVIGLPECGSIKSRPCCNMDEAGETCVSRTSRDSHRKP